MSIEEIPDIYSIEQAIEAVEKYFELDDDETETFKNHYETIVYNVNGYVMGHVWYDETHHAVVVTEY